MPKRKLLLILALTAVIGVLSWILHEEKNSSNVEAQEICVQMTGGFYVSHANGNQFSTPNPYTGGLSCPSGYRAYSLYFIKGGGNNNFEEFFQCAP